MTNGDMVRFRLPTDSEPHMPKRHVGLLVEYKSWEKIASVLYNGKILRLRAADVEKAGKRDFG